MEKDFYSIQEFADKLGVSHWTIRRAIKNGRISTFRAGSTEKSAYRIAHSEIERLSVVSLMKIVDELVENKIKNEI